MADSNDAAFLNTVVTQEILSHLNSGGAFLELAVELLKEQSIITTYMATLQGKDSGTRGGWKRNQAILLGKLVRLSKLQRGLVDQVCQEQLEIASIIHRCLVETVINILFLLKEGSEEVYSDFIESSLSKEKQLLEIIDENIAERGCELPIERRMRRSILESAARSGVDLAELPKKKNWGGNLRQRAKALGIEHMYLALFGLPSHVVHGNWQDLLSYHLREHDGEFEPVLQWSKPGPELAISATTASVECCRGFVGILRNCSEDIILRIEDVAKKIVALRDAYLSYRASGGQVQDSA